MAEAIHALAIPKLGLTMKEGTVAAWHAEPGDAVTEGAPIVDIESEKTTAVHEAPASGVLCRQIAKVGDKLPVGSLIGVIAPAAASDAEIDSFIAAYRPELAA